MPKQPDFSIEDLLRELGEINKGEGASIEEMAEAKGMCPEWVRKRIRKQVLAGMIEVRWRDGYDICGHRRKTPVYALKK